MQLIICLKIRHISTFLKKFLRGIVQFLLLRVVSSSCKHFGRQSVGDCFMATFSSMSAWNNGKALDSESGKPGSILVVGENFFLFYFHFILFFLDLYIPQTS